MEPEMERIKRELLNNSNEKQRENVATSYVTREELTEFANSVNERFQQHESAIMELHKRIVLSSLSESCQAVLETVANNPGIIQADIVTHLKLSMRTVGRGIDTLTEQGMIVAEGDRPKRYSVV